MPTPRHRHYLTSTRPDLESLLVELKAVEGRPPTLELVERCGLPEMVRITRVGRDQVGAFVEYESMGFFTTSKGAA